MILISTQFVPKIYTEKSQALIMMSPTGHETRLRHKKRTQLSTADIRRRKVKLGVFHSQLCK